MPHGMSPCATCLRARRVLSELVGLPGTGQAGAGGSARLALRCCTIGMEPIGSQSTWGHRTHTDKAEPKATPWGPKGAKASTLDALPPKMGGTLSWLDAGAKGPQLCFRAP